MKARYLLCLIALTCVIAAGVSIVPAHASSVVPGASIASTSVVRAMALPALSMLQDQAPPVAPAPEKKEVDVTVKHETTSWAVSPVWLAIGIIGAIVLVLLIGMAVRGAGARGGTTVVHE